MNSCRNSRQSSTFVLFLIKLRLTVQIIRRICKIDLLEMTNEEYSHDFDFLWAKEYSKMFILKCMWIDLTVGNSDKSQIYILFSKCLSGLCKTK